MACNHCGGNDARLLFVKKGYRLVRCSGCDLAFIENPPTADELAIIYSGAADYHRDLTDPRSEAYAALSRTADQHLDILKKYARNGRLLDVGCSTGLFLDRAARAGHEVEGVEFSSESAAFARSQFGLTVSEGDVRASPAGPWDIVTMFDVIEHVPDPSGDMRSVADLLAPGGLFLLSTPDIDGLFPRLSYLLAERLDYWPHPEPPHHLTQFSKRTLAAMLERNGFEVVGVHDTNMALSYSFGAPATLAKHPKMAAYAALFAPIAKLAPLIGKGDWFYMAARKR
jgi:2-polyprenyl-3-methyl-5-hydroxy-6-metoxy-1,4-benzoquinol methylase